MEEFDLIIIGSGAGMNIVDPAIANGMRVALVENGPLGGTCLNRGCIPSKMWIYPADVVRTIQDGVKVGVHCRVEGLDFEMVRKRTWDVVLGDRHHMEEAVRSDPMVRLFPVTGHFIGDRTMQVGDDQIHAPKVVISAGGRTNIPDIPGLKDVPYLTSENVFDIVDLPESMVMLGGGFKSCEFAHFFSAFGVKVSIVQHHPRLVSNEEPEISHMVRKKLGQYVSITTNQDVVEVRGAGADIVVVRRDRTTGQVEQESAHALFLGTGTCSNADLLKVEAAGVKVDELGFVQVNQFLETTAPGVWALGDITGKHMFRHTANYESQVVWFNMNSEQKAVIDEHAIPHAVYTYPTVGSVGLTESEAVSRGYKILVGYNQYGNVAKGNAMGDSESLVKVVVEKGTRRVLGASIAGPQADLLVQQVGYLMNCGDQSYMPMAHAQVIHPALSEVVIGAFARLIDPDAPDHQHL